MYNISDNQGRIQKFVGGGGYKSLWGYKTSVVMFNSRSDVIFTPQKVYFNWTDFGFIYTHIPAVATPLVTILVPFVVYMECQY